MKKIITFIVSSFLIFFTLEANERDFSANTSSYTSIDEKDCITLDSDNVGSIQECESFAGIIVKVIEGDIRQSIILTRDEKEYDLDFTSTVSSAFSSLGLKIEWRHEFGKLKRFKPMNQTLMQMTSSIHNQKQPIQILIQLMNQILKQMVQVTLTMVVTTKF